MVSRKVLRSLKLAFALSAAVTLAACSAADAPKHLKPLSYRTLTDLQQKGLSPADPILMRIFKAESELEVWKLSAVDGKYRHFKTYEICKWSGELGPKFKEGDRQAPEGFYHVTPALMNPNSSFHLSFNIGFPNSFDRSHGRTGSHLMVHGECSSAGCYAMENDQIEEIYALARDAFAAGQKAFQVQAFPFRMTPKNMAMHAENPHMSFWRTLKQGHDHFEVTRQQPNVDVCGRTYKFNAEPVGGARFIPHAACPAYEVPEEIAVAVAAKQYEDSNQEQIILASMQGRAETLVAGAAAPAPPGASSGAPSVTAALASTGQSSAQSGNFFSRLIGRNAATTTAEPAEADPAQSAATAPAAPPPRPAAPVQAAPAPVPAPVLVTSPTPSAPTDAVSEATPADTISSEASPAFAAEPFAVPSAPVAPVATETPTPAAPSRVWDRWSLRSDGTAAQTGG